MKGIVYNLLEASVTAEYGGEVWDDLLRSAGLQGAYTSVGSYPDADLAALVQAASAALDTPPQAIIRWFGRRAMPQFAERYPQLLSPHTSARAFVLTLNRIIHPEVRKLYPGAEVPDFAFETPDESTLVMTYRSQRRLCAFAEGLLEGAAAHYGESVSILQPECMLHGDEACVLEVRFA